MRSRWCSVMLKGIFWIISQGLRYKYLSLLFWMLCRVRAAGTRGGDVQGGLAPCSLLPLETSCLGLVLDVLTAPQRPGLCSGLLEQSKPHCVLTSSWMSVGPLCSRLMKGEMLDEQPCTGAGFGPGIYAYTYSGSNTERAER